MGILGRKRRRSAPNGPQVRRGNGTLPDEAPRPQPERREPELRDPSLSDLLRRDYKAIVVRAGKEALADGVTDVAAALAYYAFLAIPAALLVAVGIFSLVAGPGTVDSAMERLQGVVPADAIDLLRESLTRMTENSSGGLAMVLLGFLLALWTTTGAMTGLMRGLNRVYDRKETRNFLKQRITALAMLACMLLAFALSFGLLVLGPVIADWLGGVLGLESAFGWIWWTLQWPILVLGLLLAFAGILYLGPNVDHPRWQFLTPGAVFAGLVWLVASGLFAVYVSMFGSYNKAWGSLAAVIVMLTWLWLSALALLLGAEINSEAERSRELRQGKPAEEELQAPAKA
ncbi:MAG: YihY/virulence factor BrkB family protein [Gaiellaceae bacterium]